MIAELLMAYGVGALIYAAVFFVLWCWSDEPEPAGSRLVPELRERRVFARFLLATPIWPAAVTLVAFIGLMVLLKVIVPAVINDARGSSPTKEADE